MLAANILLLDGQRARDRGDRQVEEILDLGSVRRPVWAADRRQKPLRRVHVVKFVGERRQELGSQLVQLERRTGEDRVGAYRAEGDGRAGYALSGYCVATTAATAAETPSDDAIMAW